MKIKANLWWDWANEFSIYISHLPCCFEFSIGKVGVGISWFSKRSIKR